MSTALASCASQIASSGGNDDKIGCKFDGERVCEGTLTAPLTTSGSGGLTTSNQSYLQQNTPVTTWVMVPLKAPGGSEIDVNCEVNLAQKKVIYVNPTPSGTVSDSDRQWLQNTGLCIGSTATEAPPKLSGQQ
ncbi:MAG TPA: hypothetical protein VE243_05445 [Candidatus Acidoferrum sp.]|nr:hypothetical protein [Candidatus Acidoferrum sp.]